MFKLNVVKCHACTRHHHATKRAHADCPVDGEPAINHAEQNLCPLGKFVGVNASAAKPRPPRDARYLALWLLIHRRPTQPYDPASEAEWAEEHFWRKIPGSCKCRDERAAYPPLDFTSPATHFASSAILHNHVRRKQGKPEYSIIRAARIHGAEALFPPFVGPLPPIRLNVYIDWSLGDEVVLTAALRDLLAAYPGQYDVRIRCKSPEVFDNLPVSTTPHADPELEWTFAAHPYEPHHHFIEFARHQLERVINRKIPAGPLRPWLVLSDAEKAEPPVVEGAYWVMAAGSKLDCTTKGYGRWQEVVDGLKGKVQFVQVGGVGPEHVEQHLSGTSDLTGKTTVRELIRLVAHPQCQGVVSAITGVMHIGAAFGKPLVVLAGAREDDHTARYAGAEWLRTYPPCAGCWRLRVHPFKQKNAAHE